MTVTFNRGDDKPDLSLFFPVYRDENTVRTVTEKGIALLEEVSRHYEIIIVDDGSPDRSGTIADDLAGQYDCVRVIHHDGNRGYGEAIKTGIAACSYEWICFTDGDDEYDVFDLLKLIDLRDHYDLIITFRYVRLYSTFRVFISRIYNLVLRLMFRSRFRDISTGMRMVRKSVVEKINIESSSPFVGAEITLKLMLMGYRIGEVGIQTFPRAFGRGASVTVPNIIATIRDLLGTYRRIFSEDYNLPPGRQRGDDRHTPNRWTQGRRRKTGTGS